EVTHLPNPNELYLRVVEEMYEPEAVEARMQPGDEDEEEEESAKVGPAGSSDQEHEEVRRGTALGVRRCSVAGRHYIVTQQLEHVPTSLIVPEELDAGLPPPHPHSVPHRAGPHPGLGRLQQR